MHVLGIGETLDLGAMYAGLQSRGHEVRVFVGDPDSRDVYGGMLHVVDNWQNELAWVRGAGREGIIVFESALRGLQQDALRQQGYQVIGGSALGDRLEADREFGQAMLRAAGLLTARCCRFTGYAAAIDFLRRRGGRYVLKYNGADSPRTRNYVGELEDGSDMVALLNLYDRRKKGDAAPDFVLMEYVQGVEVGVGAYFNGRDFLTPACMDFEHKHFFPGELGELTGEMGTVVTYELSARLFNATLRPLASVLAGSGYCGYINLNLIVNAQGIWPLEFTSRFGYPGFVICEALQLACWEDIFRSMLDRSSLHLSVQSGFATGVVLTVPPFPYREGYAELSKGEPICFRPGTSDEDRRAIHFGEVAMAGDQLVTSGVNGYIAVATGVGSTVEEASQRACRIAGQLVVPNLRYRRDIGERVYRHDLAELRRLGWIDTAFS
ncbi:MAG: phosphoribosylglycinamide synthetase [Polaromonas sp.]|nr:phosphoribosylglycinamide synthetase [Polaromonas sp.]